ncbi:MAG: ATP-grasp domain-containing protein [Hyphomonadaceae bacterium]|nr:ATP-grasp domain-containing protein [Hyphomonadaceae bacterium]
MTERFGILSALPMEAAAPRVAHALTQNGAEVCVVAPQDSYVALTKFKKADILMPASQIAGKMPAIATVLAEDFGAHSILAADIGGFALLARLVGQLDRLNLSDATRAMISRSMPPPGKAIELISGAAFIVRQDGDLCSPPRSLLNPVADDAVHFARMAAYPVMLKRDGGSGGAGVTRCNSEAELLCALKQPHPHAGFVVQEFLPGPVYSVALSGVAGRVAAAFAFEKHVTWGAHGVETVLKYVWRPDILSHARRLYERYELNGYCGVDYIADAEGGAHLLELNACVVPESHFAGTFGVDLTASMLALLRNQPIPDAQPPKHEYVALFPQEWQRDPASPFLSTAFHDVPWEDTAVLSALTRGPVGLAERRAA